MNGLLAWWGIPGAEGCAIDARTRRTLALVGHLNEVLREASSRQSEALCAANDEYIRALQAMLKARQPAELTRSIHDNRPFFQPIIAAAIRCSVRGDRCELVLSVQRVGS